MKYLVQHDFTKSHPQWNASYRETFGDRNEGFYIEGKTEQEAWINWNLSQLPGNRINKFYVKIMEV